MTERRPPLAGEAPEPGTPRHASPLRVSLDVTAVPRLPAGAGRYTLDLAAQLGRREDVALSLVARADDAPRWRRLVPAAGTEALAPTPRPLRLLWEQAALPRLLDRLGVDVHHGPHYTMPEGTRLPRVVTIHDLSFFDHPEWHQRSKVALFRRAVRRAVRQAEALVCVSATTAAHLRELFSPAGEIHVVHHGVDHDRFRPGGDDDREDMRLLAKAGVRPPYVAFVGTIEPRKDVPTLLRAFDRMCRAHAGLTVVLAGGRGWGLEPVEAALRAARSPGRVRWLGYVSDELVPPLLRRSAAVAYPSLE
ncbi:MAG: glycosyltransferase family 4 protein, partial [Acidimicrobiales bacterium]